MNKNDIIQRAFEFCYLVKFETVKVDDLRIFEISVKKYKSSNKDNIEHFKK